MELQLDLKITNTTDNDDQTTDFRIAKVCPIFLSTETQHNFILTAHLIGYGMEDIKIDINEDGTLISISGENNSKAVQEKEMVMMHNKEPNLIKVLKIPQGVSLDGIKANYNDDESTLTIYMPKLSKGIVVGGARIEEVKDDQDNLELLRKKKVEEINHVTNGGREINQVVSDTVMTREIQQEIEHDNVEEDEEIVEENLGLGDGFETKQLGNDKEDFHEINENYTTNCKLFGPCFFIGSTFVASLLMLFVRLVKPKSH